MARHIDPRRRKDGSDVLLVDDDIILGRALGRVLRRSGLRATVCADPREALDLLLGRPWDLLLTDFEMPGMRGDVLADRAVAIDPGLPVVFITGSPDAVPERWRCAPVLEKPCPPSELIRIIEVHRRRLASAHDEEPRPRALPRPGLTPLPQGAS